MWAAVWRLTLLLRRLPRPCRVIIGSALLGAFRFGTTRWHYAARAIGLGALLERAGRHTIIGPGVYIIKPELLRMGDDVSINHFTYVDASGRLEIGNHVRVGNHTTIVTGNHDMTRHAVRRSPVTIQQSVWIGAGSRILAGVCIGSHAVVGAGAVVTRDVDAGDTVAGVPARRISGLRISESE